MKLFCARKCVSGFSRTDLAILLVAITFFVVIGVPMLKRALPKGSNCIGNLKQIGLAFRLFANDGGPSEFPMGRPMPDGSLEFNETGKVFRHFLALSNYLKSPAFLLCDQDRKRIAVTNWSAGLSNQNVSYFVGIDAEELRFEMPLCGDRTITGGIMTNGNVMLLTSNSPAGWTKHLHWKFGNICFADGSVQSFSEQELRKKLPVIANSRSLTQFAPELSNDFRYIRATTPIIRLAIP